MPAPKKFNPAPTTPQSYSPVRSSDSAKGRYAVVPQAPKPHTAEEDPVEIAVDEVTVVMEPKPHTAEEDPVEIAVDEVTVVMENVSKYERRSLNAHIEPGLTLDLNDLEDLDEVDEVPEPVEPVRPAPMTFGEWRTESSLEGTHYHRKDSRRT